METANRKNVETIYGNIIIIHFRFQFSENRMPMKNTSYILKPESTEIFKIIVYLAKFWQYEGVPNMYQTSGRP